MNKLIILMVILSFWTKNSRCENNDGFFKLKEENGIVLSCRWISTPDNRKTREIKAAFQVEAKPAQIIGFLRDEQMANQWMHGVKEIKMLSSEENGDWYVYLLYNIPWPFNKQDCILHYRPAKTSGEKQIIMTFQGEPGYLTNKEGIDRIPHISGSWKITENGDGKCTVEYAVYSYQKLRFPRWASDPVVQNNLIDTMISFKEMATKYGQNQSL